jgi:hypothetical protein
MDQLVFCSVKIKVIQAPYVYTVLIRCGTRVAERVNTANPAKKVFCFSGIELIESEIFLPFE